MRGFLQPSIKPIASESQAAFRALSRGRRSKLAKAAQTTLIKADQWARGDAVTADVAEAIERAFKSGQTKEKPAAKKA